MKAALSKRMTALLAGGMLAACFPSGMGQDVYLSEDFSAFSLSAGAWSGPESDTAHFMVVPSANAGGAAPELVMGCGADLGLPKINDTVRLATSPVLLGEKENLLVFKSFYFSSKSSNKRNFGIEVREEGGSWTCLYAKRTSVSGLQTTEVEKIRVALPDSLAGKTVQIAFFLCNSDPVSADYLWYVDDVMLAAYSDSADASLRYQGETYSLEEEYSMALELTNASTQAFSRCSGYYAIDGGQPAPFSREFLSPLQAGETVSLRIPVPEWAGLEGGRRGFAAWVASLDTVAVAEPDTLRFSVVKVDSSRRFPQTPLLEIFGSVYCSYCAAANEYMNPVLEAMGDTVSVIKYHTTFMGNDPYATQTGDDRFLWYYSPSDGLPRMNGNGAVWPKEGPGAINALRALLDTHPETFLSIRFDTVYLDADGHVRGMVVVRSTADVSGLEVFVALTQGAVGGEYHDVLRSLSPVDGAFGLSFEMDSSCLYELDFDASYLEEEAREDLSLVVFVQEGDARQVLQSASAKVSVPGGGGVGNEDDGDAGAYSGESVPGVSVHAQDRVIYVKNNASSCYQVFNLQGHLIYEGRDASVAVDAPGLYLVRIGAKVWKVAVL